MSEATFSLGTSSVPSVLHGIEAEPGEPLPALPDALTDHEPVRRVGIRPDLECEVIALWWARLHAPTEAPIATIPRRCPPAPPAEPEALHAVEERVGFPRHLLVERPEPRAPGDDRVVDLRPPASPADDAWERFWSADVPVDTKASAVLDD